MEHAYPYRPIRLIVPYPAGGGADHWGRVIAKALGDQLGKPVMVENIPGAGGNNGTTVAASAAPDGYTLLLGSVGPLVVHPLTYDTLGFHADKDFAPIALLESSPILMVAFPTVPAASAKELIALARRKRELLSYASNGNGSPEQVAGELFNQRAGVAIRHVPFDGAGPARKALLAGQVSVMFDPCKGALPAIQRGSEKPLAVAAQSRLSILPDVPTFAEIGIQRYYLRIWTGVLAPAGTPPQIISQLNEGVQRALQDEKVKREIQAEGGEPGATSPVQFATFLQSERRRWRKLVKEAVFLKCHDLTLARSSLPHREQSRSNTTVSPSHAPRSRRVLSALHEIRP